MENIKIERQGRLSTKKFWKKIASVGVLIILLFSGIVIVPHYATGDNPGDGGSECINSVVINAIHTAWVDNDHPDQNNYDDEMLHVRAQPKHHGGWNIRRSYYYFDLSDLPSGAIVSSEFMIDPNGGDPGLMDIHLTDWNGDSITWNTAPSIGTLVDSEYYDGGTDTQSFNVTSALSSHPANISFVLKFEDENPSSKEHDDHMNPRLVITVNECIRTGLNITKTVWNGNGWSGSTKANVNETVRFNISVHNTGDENLININITDYLPDCLQYAGNSTVNGLSQAPNSTWKNNVTWLFSGPLTPDSWIYIEFNATVVPEPELPEDPVSMKVFANSTNSNFNTHLYDIPAGYDVTNGWYVGWCADSTIYINTGYHYEVRLYSSYDTNMPFSAKDDEQWDMINYILNHKPPDATWKEIQGAIWYFADSSPNYPSGYFTSKTQDIINDALANGENYVPPIGGVMAVICYINDCRQLTFIELEVTPNHGTNINKANVTAVGESSSETVYDEDTADVEKVSPGISVTKEVNQSIIHLSLIHI